MSDTARQRQHFRIRFPEKERPRLFAEHSDFVVTEISEGGVRVSHDGPPPLCFSLAASVRIEFVNGSEATTFACLLRKEPGELVLRFTEPIPGRIIMAQQRLILSRYPQLHGEIA